MLYTWFKGKEWSYIKKNICLIRKWERQVIPSRNACSSSFFNSCVRTDFWRLLGEQRLSSKVEFLAKKPFSLQKRTSQLHKCLLAFSDAWYISECLLLTHERPEESSLEWVRRERKIQVSPDTVAPLATICMFSFLLHCSLFWFCFQMNWRMIPCAVAQGKWEMHTLPVVSWNWWDLIAVQKERRKEMHQLYRASLEGVWYLFVLKEQFCSVHESSRDFSNSCDVEKAGCSSAVQGQ